MKFEIVIHFYDNFLHFTKICKHVADFINKSERTRDFRKLRNEELRTFHLSLNPALVINF